MNSWLLVILLTLLPGLELRASIPTGIALGLSVWGVVLVAILVNILLGVIGFFALAWVLKIMHQFKWFGSLWDKYVLRIQKKSTALVNRYGTLALALFIAVPLPGSGAYSGVVAAELLGMKFSQFLPALIVGVILAGIVVALLSVLGVAAFQAMLV